MTFFIPVEDWDGAEIDEGVWLISDVSCGKSSPSGDWILLLHQPFKSIPLSRDEGCAPGAFIAQRETIGKPYREKAPPRRRDPR